jgi:excisionase family DNA binding protein
MNNEWPTFLTPAEVAKRLRIHPATLAQWRKNDEGPAYVRVGSEFRYSEEAILTYISVNWWPPMQTPESRVAQ